MSKMLDANEERLVVTLQTVVETYKLTGLSFWWDKVLEAVDNIEEYRRHGQGKRVRSNVPKAPVHR